MRDDLVPLLFERAGPLVERLERAGPYASGAELLRRAREILLSLPETDQIAVINAHPRIGERPEAIKAQSETSFREQGYDRDATSPEVFEELRRLNAEYEKKFGFRFVVFVNRRPKAAIVPVLEQRMARSRADELATALEEVLAIAADRLARDPSPVRGSGQADPSPLRGSG